LIRGINKERRKENLLEIFIRNYSAVEFNFVVKMVNNKIYY